MPATAPLLPRPGGPVPFTADDGLQAVAGKIAERNGADAFKVRLHRLTGMGGVPSHIATLEGATLEHLANPEQWIPPLAGGGPVFLLSVVHAEETLPCANWRVTLPGAPLDKINLAAVKEPTWKGPPVITYPAAAKPPVPTATGDLDALRTLLGVPVSASEAATSRGLGQNGAGGDSGHSSAEIMRRLELDAIARALEETRKATERQTQMMIEAVRALQQQPKPEPKSLAQIIADATPAIAAIGAIITPIIVSSREGAAKEREARLALDAAQREREEKANEKMLALLAAGNERSASVQKDMMGMMTPMVQSVSVMGNTMLQQIATMKELASGAEPESEFLQILKAGAGALGEFWAARTAMTPPAPVQPQRLTAGQPPAPSEGTEPEGGEAPEGEAAAANGAAPAPANGAPAAPTPDQEKEREREWLRTSSAEAVLQATTAAIQREHDPAELAESFLDAIALNPGVAQTVRQAGNPMKVFRPRLGEPWVAGHMPYVMKLLSTLNLAAKRRGAK